MSALGRQPKIPARFSAIYHVSPEGIDSNDGSRRRPFKTIQKALDIVQPGEKVSVAAGVYNECLEIKTSGQPGKPVVLEGERGGKGEWITILDGARPVGPVWEAAPEVGQGVFKTAKIPFEPRIITLGDKYLPRIWDTHMRSGLGLQKLAYPAGKIVEIYGNKIDYWDSISGMYGSLDKTTYIRFRDGDDPNRLPLRAAPAGIGISISNRSHVVVRNFLVRGNDTAVVIEGAGATGNIIEENRLINGCARIAIQNGAARNHVRFNDMTARFFGDRHKPGPWGGGVTNAGARLILYEEFKCFFGPGTTYDYGVRLRAAGDGNEIYGNLIREGGMGIWVSGGGPGKPATSRLKIYNNTIRNFSSQGILAYMAGVRDIEVCRNLIYDCNINLRIHSINEPQQLPGRSLYVYGNFFYEPPGSGTHVYFHYFPMEGAAPSNYPHARIAIYHNSFAGGSAALLVSSLSTNIGGLPGSCILNNAISAKYSVIAGTTEGMLGAFDYNWCGGIFSTAGTNVNDYTRAPWYGTRNHFQKGAKIWIEAQMPDFIIPAESSARQSGLDISQPFTLNGKECNPLPGFSPGYFAGPKPDMGAMPEIYNVSGK